jgi:hypothetical protein
MSEISRQNLLRHQCTHKNMKDRKVKQVLSRDGFQWEGREHKKRVEQAEYGGCILYSCMKIEQ